MIFEFLCHYRGDCSQLFYKKNVLKNPTWGFVPIVLQNILYASSVVGDLEDYQKFYQAFHKRRYTKYARIRDDENPYFCIFYTVSAEMN